MILVDTGPLVALFDPADQDHKQCVDLLRGVDEPLCTTIPVLTEAFHLLDHLSVLDNVAFGLAMTKLRPSLAERRERAGVALAVTPWGEISGGGI